MRTRTALVLAALGVVVLVLGIVLGRGGSGGGSDALAGRLAFPGLTEKLAGATGIELVHHGHTLKLARKTTDPSAVWGLTDHDQYRAQQGKVRELLTGLTELRLSETRTADPAEYARLGVEDPKGKDAASTLVRVTDAHGALAELIVGHERAPAHGDLATVYVRRPGEAQSWLAQGHLTVNAEAQDWLDRDIVNIAQDKIAAVTVTRGGQTLGFTRQGKALALTEPADHPKLDDFKVEDVGRALENLTLEDVRPEPAPGEAVGQSVFTAADGMTVTVNVSKSGKEVWATFAASGKDAAALAAKLHGWAYEVGTWKETALVPTLDDLKAAAPPATAAKQSAPAPQ